MQMQIAVAEPITTARPALTDVPGRFNPENVRLEPYLALSIFMVSFLYLCLFRRYSWIDPDEGIILQGAQRILNGQVLYRDFFSFFTPGSYYLLALIFRIFGDSLLVAHTALALVGAAFSPITYLLSRRVCSRQSSLLVTGLMTLTALPLRFVVLHNWDSTLLACLALYCAVRLLENPCARWAFAAASFVSLTGMFEQSKGAGLLLGLGTGFLIITYKRYQPRIVTRGRLLAIALGLAWPLLITMAYFASQQAFSSMLASWFWPLHHYSTANRVAYGYPNLAQLTVFGPASWGMRLLEIVLFSPLLWFPILPLFGVALLLRLTLGAEQKALTVAEWPYYMLVSATISGLLLSVMIVRTDYTHFVYLHPLFFLIVAWLLDGRNIRSRLFVRWAPIAGFFVTMSVLVLGTASLFGTRAKNTVTTRRGTLTTRTRDEVAEYVQARVPSGEQILIYPYEPTYYYLTRTYNPTGYEYYQPGMHTKAQALDLLSELKSHPPRVVLYELGFAGHIRNSWPNTQARDLISDPVADYIVREYRVCTSLTSAASNDFIGRFQFLFMIRKDLACP
jgi:4-amino-4-deoxy-L-arabinose transferase-like glycosyltransferase